MPLKRFHTAVPKQHRTCGRPVVLAIVLLCVAAPLLACSVPVCRYALERWKADLYDVVVFHDTDLSKAQGQLLETLRPDAEGVKPANVHVTLVNVKEDVPPLYAPMWEAVKDKSLPRMALRYPDPRIAPAGIWSGELTADSVSQIVQSRTRRLLGEELLKGTSAVWILMQSGDKAKDTAAQETLTARLKHLEETLEISQPDEQDIAEGLINSGTGKLELSFRVLTVARDDPAEEFFIQSLLHTEEDLRDEEYVDQPMAFPVFGRGRCLYALIGKGIAAENIDEACQFLAGPCSCQVKDQNPGVDLLMSVDWDGLVNSTIDVDTSLPPLVGLSGFSDELAEASTTDSTPADPVEPAQAPAPTEAQGPSTAVALGAESTSGNISGIMKNVSLLAIGAAIGIILFSIFLVRRQSPQ